MKNYMNHSEDTMLKAHLPKACVAAALLFSVSMSAEAQSATDGATPGEDVSLQAAYNAAASKYALDFDITELTASQVMAKADALVREAGKAYQSGAYQKAVGLYLKTIAILKKLPENPEVLRKAENCRQAISACYYFWAEKLYFDAQASTDAKQYEQAVDLCRKAAEVWPASKNKMEEMIARISKLAALQHRRPAAPGRRSLP